MTYKLLIKDRVRYMCLVLLNEIINFQTYFPVVLTGEDIYLGPYLDQMVSNGALEKRDGEYIPTSLGRDELTNFYARYYEYLKLYDLYSAVDLEVGEFAFSRISDESFSDEDWFEYLGDERFSDVRIAVADFKGLNPTEIVFMSFLNEGRFDVSLERWQYNLTNENDGIWNEIEDTCNTAISLEYLSHDQVIEDVIEQGTAIALDLIRKADQINADNATLCFPEEDEVVETTETYVEIVEMPVYGYDYWDPYYDPYYVSPIWLVPVLLW